MSSDCLFFARKGILPKANETLDSFRDRAFRILKVSTAGRGISGFKLFRYVDMSWVPVEQYTPAWGVFGFTEFCGDGVSVYAPQETTLLMKLFREDTETILHHEMGHVLRQQIDDRYDEPFANFVSLKSSFVRLLAAGWGLHTRIEILVAAIFFCMGANIALVFFMTMLPFLHAYYRGASMRGKLFDAFLKLKNKYKKDAIILLSMLKCQEIDNFSSVEFMEEAWVREGLARGQLLNELNVSGKFF